MTEKEDSVNWENSTHPEMTACWNHLPLVPLGIVLQHLSPEDALHAMSVCRHWRSALSHYHGNRETIKLQASHELERSVLVARVFRKRARRLRVLLDGPPCQVAQFISCVVPLFFDSLKLEEVFFIGPMMIEIEEEVKICRMLLESLMYKQLDSLKLLAVAGCDLETPSLPDRYTQIKNIDFYTLPLTLSQEISQTNSVLQYLAVDYDQINTLSLKTMSALPHLSRLTMFIVGEKQPTLKPIDWPGLRPCFPNGLEVALICIDLIEDQMEEVIHNVLVDDMNLVSLKMLFNNTLYCPILYHLADKYKTSLREIVWADAPQPRHEKIIDDHRFYFDHGYRELMTCDMNPFIIMCWQCKNLRTIVIHGYWTWQYDIVGFFRMRPTLERVEVSALRAGPSPRQSSRAGRVRVGDRPPRLTKKLIMKINEYTGYKWSPISWDSLHSGIRANSTEIQRADYIAEETTNINWAWVQ